MSEFNAQIPGNHGNYEKLTLMFCVMLQMEETMTDTSAFPTIKRTTTSATATCQGQQLPGQSQEKGN